MHPRPGGAPERPGPRTRHQPADQAKPEHEQDEDGRRHGEFAERWLT
jgi:hypothetical protein